MISMTANVDCGRSLPWRGMRRVGGAVLFNAREPADNRRTPGAGARRSPGSGRPSARGRCDGWDGTGWPPRLTTDPSAALTWGLLSSLDGAKPSAIFRPPAGETGPAGVGWWEMGDLITYTCIFSPLAPNCGGIPSNANSFLTVSPTAPSASSQIMNCLSWSVVEFSFVFFNTRIGLCKVCGGGGECVQRALTNRLLCLQSPNCWFRVGSPLTSAITWAQCAVFW